MLLSSFFPVLVDPHSTEDPLPRFHFLKGTKPLENPKWETPTYTSWWLNQPPFEKY